MKTCPSELSAFTQIDGCNFAPPKDASGCSASAAACAQCGNHSTSTSIFCAVTVTPSPTPSQPSSDGRCCYDVDTCPTKLAPFTEVDGCNFAAPKDASGCSASEDACATCGSHSSSTATYCPVTTSDSLIESMARTQQSRDEGRCCWDMETCPAELGAFTQIDGCNFAPPKDASGCSASAAACAKCGNASSSTATYCPVSTSSALIEAVAVAAASRDEGRCCWDMTTCPAELGASTQIDGCNFAPPADASGCSASAAACAQC